ncbi:hypothetical protein MASR1M65_32150 [Saprospiraceae bacterium]
MVFDFVVRAVAVFLPHEVRVESVGNDEVAYVVRVFNSISLADYRAVRVAKDVDLA